MKLYEAAQDVELMKELREFFTANLKEMAVERVFERQDTAAIADAAEAISRAFEAIEIQFQPKPKPKEVVDPAV